MKKDLKLARIVATHPFLSGIKPAVRKVFLECASIQRFSQRQRLFNEGAQAEYFYLVNQGQVLLEVAVPGRESLSIQALGAGDALGWSWLFPPFQWRFTATAVQPTETIAFEAERLRELAKVHPKFCCELVARLAGLLAGRLEDVRTRLLYASQEMRIS